MPQIVATDVKKALKRLGQYVQNLEAQISYMQKQLNQYKKDIKVREEQNIQHSAAIKANQEWIAFANAQIDDIHTDLETTHKELLETKKEITDLSSKIEG